MKRLLLGVACATGFSLALAALFMALCRLAGATSQGFGYYLCLSLGTTIGGIVFVAIAFRWASRRLNSP